jgi:L-threonylcarbamoyladenylate synthase
MPRIAEPAPATIAEAAARLRGGGVVAFPTETVYGLGAGTFDERGLARVYELKGRPRDNPLIAHVEGALMARRLAAGWDARADALAARFWPGPLTIVVEKAADVPALATAGWPTIAIRAPRHDVARALIVAYGGAISAPSANRSGRVSPTSARHVAADFADVADLLILDGGPCAIGLESTVIDLAGGPDAPPRILRPGMVSETDVAEVIGPVEGVRVRRQEASPGTRLQHYAPRARAELVEPGALASRLADLAGAGERAVVLAFHRAAVLPPHRAIEMPQGAGDYGRVLYAQLRAADATCDEERFHRIVIERPPDTNPAWKVVIDRLERATA